MVKTILLAFIMHVVHTKTYNHKQILEESPVKQLNDTIPISRELKPPPGSGKLLAITIFLTNSRQNHRQSASFHLAIRAQIIDNVIDCLLHNYPVYLLVYL